VEIIYGYPTDKAFEMEARGEIYLGGCCIEYDENGKVNPDYHCNACGNDFGHEDKCIHAKAETEVEK
jgi:hypothetical protein